MSDISGPAEPPRDKISDAKTAPVDPGLIRRAMEQLGAIVRGVRGDAGSARQAQPGTDVPPRLEPHLPVPEWFGPRQPQRPLAPEGAAVGRQFDYPTGFNLNVRPRAYEEIDFPKLRQLGDAYDLLRLCIETRKDQLSKVGWKILPKKEAGQSSRARADERCEKLQKFFLMPDRQNDWFTWLRMLLEDMFVIDAPTIYVRKTLDDSDVWALEIVDGATIKRIISEDGRTPLPPDAAYQQILKGMPAVNYTTDEIIYRPRNPRSWKVYGFSPVEQVLMTVNIALRRQVAQLQHYTEGNIPEALAGVPEGWTPQMIGEFQRYWDSVMEGNTAARRHMKFVPGGIQVQQTRAENGLMDQFDEWLARVVCYAFSLPPLPFVKQVNRACYSEDTETLTERGWRTLDEIGEGEKIATFNPESGNIEFHAPVGRYVYDYAGEMIRFLTAGVDVLVTPEHKMWMRGDHAGSYRKVAAEDVPSSQFHFLAAAGFEGEERAEFILPGIEKKGSRHKRPITVPMDDWLELLGYYLSEGGLSHTQDHAFWTIAQKDGPKADKIAAALARLPFRFGGGAVDRHGMRRWNVYGKHLGKWLLENAGGRCGDKRIPRDLLGLSHRQLSILFDAMMLGDGTWDGRESRTSGAYHTTSRLLADDFQELAARLGWSAALDEHYPAHGARAQAWRVRICRRVEFSLRGKATERTPGSVSREAYSGRVYCFEVPNHLFVTRRNGKIGIHGNTAETAQEAALEEGLEPIMKWVKDLIDFILLKYWGHSDLEFVWDDDELPEPEELVGINTSYVTRGIKHIDEARMDLGLEPYGIEPIIFGVGPAGFLFLSQLKDPALRDIITGLAPNPAAQPQVDPATGQPIGQPGAAPGAGGAPGGSAPLADLPPELLQAIGMTSEDVAAGGRGALEPELVEMAGDAPLADIPSSLAREIGMGKADGVALIHDALARRGKFVSDEPLEEQMTKMADTVARMVAARLPANDHPMEKREPTAPVSVNVAPAAPQPPLRKRVELVRGPNGQLIAANIIEEPADVEG